MRIFLAFSFDDSMFFSIVLAFSVSEGDNMVEYFTSFCICSRFFRICSVVAFTLKPGWADVSWEIAAEPQQENIKERTTIEGNDLIMALSFFCKSVQLFAEVANYRPIFIVAAHSRKGRHSPDDQVGLSDSLDLAV
jgi:hypothetical protein